MTQVLLRNNTMGDLEAYGVEFVRANQTYTVYASSEVILSAGKCLKAMIFLELIVFLP